MRGFGLVFFIFLFFTTGAQAGEATTLGSACTNGWHRADWDSLFQCVSGVWKRAAYWFGLSSDTCDAAHAGIIQWDGSAFKGCDGAHWLILAGGNSLHFVGLNTPQIVEYSYTGRVNVKIALPGIPTGARYMLADVFSSVGYDCGSTTQADHTVFKLGRSVIAGSDWVEGFGQRPSSQFTNTAQQAVYLVSQGQMGDWAGPYFGTWFPSLTIPINADATVSMDNTSVDCSDTGYLYFVIKAYSY